VLTLEHLPDDSKVIIDGSKSTFIDYDVLEVIQDFKISALDRNITLQLIDVPEVTMVSAH
jgi:MFS superfamily sulfate permease-like transporter